MKNKKIMMYVGIVLIVLILIGIGYIIFNNIKNNLVKGNSKYGIMWVKSDHYITNEEAIVIMKEQLEGKLKRIKKGNREDNLKKLINEKYKVSKDVKEVIKIMDIIEEFNKNN